MQLEVKKGQTINLSDAERIIKENKQNFKGQPSFFKGLTTNKLRNLLDMVNNVYVKVYNRSEDRLSEEILDDLQYLKVKFAYEAGRERSVKDFVNKTHVSTLLNSVIQNGSKKAFLDYCKYFEALVAYAKFYGMGDK